MMKTQKYTFKSPDLRELKKLGSLITFSDDFKGRFGGVLHLVNVRMEDGLLSTLMQFYDPVYRCFTFTDYQLAPTLEEYSYLLGIPVSDKVPFSGLEEFPKTEKIADFLHLSKVEVDKNLVVKGGLKGFTAKFLLGKAHMLADSGSLDALESIYALLVYGLCLFPNIDNFVDAHAIQCILIGNPVPTLLADTYHSIHLRHSKSGGMVVCCIPLLYQWFISHLPVTPAFWDKKDGLRWSQKILALHHEDIKWYSRVYDDTLVIDSCGEFPNVPLLGTRGAINYNPVIARRQLGFPMMDKPLNIYVEGFFLKDSDADQSLRHRIVRAWHRICRKGRQELGKKNCIAAEPYLQWVRDRASSLRMPDIHPQSVALSSEIFADSQLAIAKVEQERDLWKKRYVEAQAEVHQMKIQVEKANRYLRWRNEDDQEAKRQKTAQSVIGVPEDMQGVVIQLLLSKTQMRQEYESRIRELEDALSTARRGT